MPIAQVGGTLGQGTRTEVIERTFVTTRSTEFAAILIAGGAWNLADIRLTVLVQEALRHAKVAGTLCRYRRPTACGSAVSW